jgi:ABC transporter DrrB family efflux protein
LFRGYGAILRKELLHLRRDPVTVVFALAIPIFQLVIFGYAIDMDIKHIPTAILDFDQTQESRRFVASLVNTQYARIVAAPRSGEELREVIRSGKAQLGIEIPPGFGRGVSQGTGSQVLALVDGSDSQVAFRAQAVVAQMAVAHQTAYVEPLVDVRQRVLYNPDTRSANFMVPGLIGIILQVVTVALTAFSMVREREQGTLEQLMVSPVGKLGLLLGKLVPYAVLGVAEVTVVILVGRLLFGVPVHGSLILLFLLSIPFLLAALGLGLLISAIARTQGQALQGFLAIMLPSILLSGFVFPRASMPTLIYYLSYLVPVTYYLETLRGVIVRGAGFYELWPWVAALCVLTVVILVLAAARFRKSVA